MDNVWYGKGRQAGGVLRLPAVGENAESRAHRGFICIHYARGGCLNKECPFLHRVPRVGDTFPPARDCFGRERFADYKEDMGGVGQLAGENRTLWISPLKLREMDLYRVVSHYGDVEAVRVIREMAFVTFRLEACAQFAREAVDGRSLDEEGEPLKVRWAKEEARDAGAAGGGGGDPAELRRLAESLVEKLRGGKRKREEDPEEPRGGPGSPGPPEASDEHNSSLVTLSRIQKPDSLGALAAYSSDSD